MSRRKRRKSTSTPRLLGLLGVLGGLVGGVAARRRKGTPASGSSETSTSTAERPEAGAPPSDTAATDVVEHTYTCECGEEYRVSGQDRHRVYWPKDAEVSDPVLGQACPNCERPLPHDHAAAPE